MSIIQSVADLFRAKSETPPATPFPGQAAPIIDAKAEDKTPVSPLDSFKEFWQPAKEAAPGTAPVDFKADPAKLMEAASKIDFAKVIKPEQLAAIKAGGEEATTALVEMMQTMQQATYAQSAFAATKIAETAVAQAQENFVRQLPALLRKQGLSDSLVAENPALAHPALQPVIQAMQEQFATKYPNATPTELLDLAKNYVAGMGKIFNPAPAPVAAKGSKGSETDWSKFIPESPMN